MPSPTSPSNPLPHAADLAVRGVVPPTLCGQLIGIGRDGVVHSVQLRDGRVSYGRRHIRTETVLHHLVAFGSSVLAFGDDALAYELRPESDTASRVDLAGRWRSLASFPKHDPRTGDLHLVAHDPDDAPSHVVVSSGSLTRHSRRIADSPGRIGDLALSRDHVVLVADGFVGVAARDGDLRPIWIATGAAAPHLVHAAEVGDAVVVLALTPSLERWTLHPGALGIHRDVLDRTPRRFAHHGDEGADGSPRWLWTTGRSTIGHHDLTTRRHLHHDVRPRTPGDLVYVADATTANAANAANGGWLVGFVHRPSPPQAEFHVIRAADLVGLAVAPVPIGQPVPRGLRCTWIPSTQQ